MKKNVYDVNPQNVKFSKTVTKAEVAPLFTKLLPEDRLHNSYKIVKLNRDEILKTVNDQNARYQASMQWIKDNGYKILNQKVSIAFHIAPELLLEDSKEQAIYARDFPQTQELSQYSDQDLRENGVVDMLKVFEPRSINRQQLQNMMKTDPDLTSYYQQIQEKVTKFQVQKGNLNVLDSVFGDQQTVVVDNVITVRDLDPRYSHALFFGSDLMKYIIDVSVSVKNICYRETINPIAPYIKSFFMSKQLIARPDFFNGEFIDVSNNVQIIAQMRNRLLIVYAKKMQSAQIQHLATLFGGGSISDDNKLKFIDTYKTELKDLATEFQLVAGTSVDQFYKFRYKLQKYLKKYTKLGNWIVMNIISQNPVVKEYAEKLHRLLLGVDFTDQTDQYASKTQKAIMNKLFEFIKATGYLDKIMYVILLSYNEQRNGCIRGFKGLMDQQVQMLVNAYNAQPANELTLKSSFERFLQIPAIYAFFGHLLEEDGKIRSLPVRDSTSKRQLMQRLGDAYDAIDRLGLAEHYSLLRQYYPDEVLREAIRRPQDIFHEIDQTVEDTEVINQRAAGFLEQEDNDPRRIMDQQIPEQMMMRMEGTEQQALIDNVALQMEQQVVDQITAMINTDKKKSELEAQKIKEKKAKQKIYRKRNIIFDEPPVQYIIGDTQQVQQEQIEERKGSVPIEEEEERKGPMPREQVMGLVNEQSVTETETETEQEVVPQRRILPRRRRKVFQSDPGQAIEITQMRGEQVSEFRTELEVHEDDVSESQFKQIYQEMDEYGIGVGSVFRRLIPVMRDVYGVIVRRQFVMQWSFFQLRNNIKYWNLQEYDGMLQKVKQTLTTPIADVSKRDLFAKNLHDYALDQFIAFGIENSDTYAAMLLMVYVDLITEQHSSFTAFLLLAQNIKFVGRAIVLNNTFIKELIVDFIALRGQLNITGQASLIGEQFLLCILYINRLVGIKKFFIDVQSRDEFETDAFKVTYRHNIQVNNPFWTRIHLLGRARCKLFAQNGMASIILKTQIISRPNQLMYEKIYKGFWDIKRLIQEVADVRAYKNLSHYGKLKFSGVSGITIEIDLAEQVPVTFVAKRTMFSLWFGIQDMDQSMRLLTIKVQLSRFLQLIDLFAFKGQFTQSLVQLGVFLFINTIGTRIYQNKGRFQHIIDDFEANGIDMDSFFDKYEDNKLSQIPIVKQTGLDLNEFGKRVIPMDVRLEPVEPGPIMRQLRIDRQGVGRG